MSSDSHQAPANSNSKRDRLKRLLKYIIPCLSNDAETSIIGNSNPVHGEITDSSRPAWLHPVVATGANTADSLSLLHDSHPRPGTENFYMHLKSLF